MISVLPLIFVISSYWVPVMAHAAVLELKT